MRAPRYFALVIASVVLTASLAIFSTSVHSQVIETTLAQKSWSGSFSTSLNTNTEKYGSENHALSNDYMLILKRPIGSHTLDFNLTSAKDLNGERKYEWSKVSIGYTTPTKALNKVFDLKLKTSLTAPLNEKERKNDALISQLTLSPSLAFKLDELGFTGVSLSYLPFIRQNFHQYTVSAEGKSNTERSLRQRLALGFSITDNFSLDFDGIYQRNYTYQGTTTDSYSLDQSISYSFTPEFSCALGHSTEGSVLAEDGRTTNIEFSNVRTGTYYASAEFKF